MSRLRLLAACLLSMQCRPAPPPAPPPQRVAPEPPAQRPTPAPPAPAEFAPPPTPPASTWKVGAIDGSDVQGSLDKDVIRRVVRAHIAEVRGCYNRGLETDVDLAGRVIVQFKIGGTGAVVSAEIVASTLPPSGAAVAQCIATMASRWTFPPPEGGGSVVVTYPFVLSSEPAMPSRAGLFAGGQQPGVWFPISGHARGTLVVEVQTAGGGASAAGVEVTLTTHEPDGQRTAITDARGLAVFVDVGATGNAVVRVGKGAATTSLSSEVLLLGPTAMATLLLAP